MDDESKDMPYANMTESETKNTLDGDKILGNNISPKIMTKQSMGEGIRLNKLNQINHASSVKNKAHRNKTMRP